MLAHYVASEIIPRCRYAVDLHSGGRFGRYLPCSYLHWGGDELHKRAKLEGARAFGAPNAVIATGAANRGSMTAECDRQGVVMISCELGGGAAIERETLELAQRGIRGVLAHWGVVARSETAPAREPRLLELAGGFAGGVMAEADGLFGPVAEIGDRVAARDLAGHIFPIGALARPAIEARFAAHGLVVSRRLSPLVKRGDYLYRLARETDRAALGLK
jgi:predicted deacylase